MQIYDLTPSIHGSRTQTVNYDSQVTRPGQVSARHLPCLTLRGKDSGILFPTIIGLAGPSIRTRDETRFLPTVTVSFQNSDAGCHFPAPLLHLSNRFFPRYHV